MTVYEFYKTSNDLFTAFTINIKYKLIENSYYLNKLHNVFKL